MIVITACKCATCFAEEAYKPNADAACASTALNSTVRNSNLANETSTDTLSDTASVRLESVDYPTLQRSNNASFTSKDSSQTNSISRTKANKNPFDEINQGHQSSPVNYARAAEQFCLAPRDINDADTQYALGWMYENGNGVTKNDNIAVKFYSIAAKQFHQSARESLSAS